MIFGLQEPCRLLIPDDLRDLCADEVGGGVVGDLVEHEVVVDRHEGEAASGPARLISGAALVVAVIESAAIWHLAVDAVARLFPRKAPDFRIVSAKRFALLRTQRGVVGGNGKIRGALKYREVARLPGDDGHRLNA